MTNFTVFVQNLKNRSTAGKIRSAILFFISMQSFSALIMKVLKLLRVSAICCFFLFFLGSILLIPEKFNKLLLKIRVP